MQILYLSQYFPPEAGATQTRAYEMARNLVLLGHQVSLIAEFPNHPSGIIPPSYRGKVFEKENLEGIDVIRVWVKASPVKNFRNRIMFYLSYMINASLVGISLGRKHFDLIYASSPPLFVGGTALFLSKILRVPFIFEVRDLWPESAIALGELSNQKAINLATSLEEACYSRSRAVVVVTRGIYDHLLERGLPGRKLALIPNGSNVVLFQFSPEERERVRSSLGVADHFIVIYAGIFGVAQDLETIVEAARLLQEVAKIHFVLIGDGPKRAEITNIVNQQRIHNLTILPEQPREKMPAYLSASDLAIIPLRNLELFKGALPSKMFDAWACERPLLLSVDGEAREIMESAQGGVYIPPEDPHAMANAILRLEQNPDELRQMGMNGRNFTVLNYSRQVLAEKLEYFLQHFS
jgi:colanic acid biosynthesis glycosyl transferase WcaI